MRSSSYTSANPIPYSSCPPMPFSLWCLPLKDYIDELLVNLHYNVQMNRSPKVVSLGNQLRHRERLSSGNKGHKDSHVTTPIERVNSIENVSLSPSSTRWQFPTTSSAAALTRLPRQENVDGNRLDGGLLLCDTGNSDRYSSGSASVNSKSGNGNSTVVESGARYSPLSCVHVRKLDWTTFAGKGSGAAESEASEEWWEDEGAEVAPGGFSLFFLVWSRDICAVL